MSTKQPLVSAVIISYNGMEFLPDCLRTLTADMSGIAGEVIVVDNNSSDGSAEFVAREYPQVRLIRNKKNTGFAGAVNIGLQNARADYIYLLNQDLRFRPGCLRRLLSRLEQDKTIGMIGPAYYDFNGKLLSSARAFPRYRDIFYSVAMLDKLFSDSQEFARWKMGWFDHKTEKFVDQPMGSVMLLRAEAVRKTGEMDERFWLFMNDVDYCRRLEQAGYRRLYFPEAEVEHYAGGATSRIPYRMILISHFAMIRYFRKYVKWWQWPSFLLTALVLMAAVVPRLCARFLRNRLTSERPSSGSA